MITNHIKKLLFILVIYLLTIQSALSLVNGKPFEKLPAGGDIRSFSLQVVGIVTYYGNESQGKCTGIIISDNTILSTEHCFYGKSISKIDIVPFDYSEIKPFSLGEFDYEINFDTQNYIDECSQKQRQLSTDIKCKITDIAVIKLKNKINGIINLPIVDNIIELNNIMFNSNTIFYAFGWGSHRKFEYISIKNTVDNSLNNKYILYPTNDQQSLPFWSYVNLQGETIPDKEFCKKLYDSFVEAMEYNIRYDSSPVDSWVLTPREDSVTIPNLMLSKAYTDSENNSLNAEPGDSGGPIMACNNEGKVCQLVGLIRGGCLSSTDAGGCSVFTANYITTFAMPFAKKLLR